MLREVLSILPKRLAIDLQVFEKRSYAESDDTFQPGLKFVRCHRHEFTGPPFTLDDVGLMQTHLAILHAAVTRRPHRGDWRR